MGRKVRVSQNSLNNYNSKLSNSSLCSCDMSVIFTKQSRREKNCLNATKVKKKSKRYCPGKGLLIRFHLWCTKLPSSIIMF